jgi:hypothetical protein
MMLGQFLTGHPQTCYTASRIQKTARAVCQPVSFTVVLYDVPYQEKGFPHDDQAELNNPPHTEHRQSTPQVRPIPMMCAANVTGSSPVVTPCAN